MCGAHSVHVAGMAEEMGVQGETLRAGLIGELLSTLLGGGGRHTDKRGMRAGSEVKLLQDKRPNLHAHHICFAL